MKNYSTFRVINLSVTIDQPANLVYKYISNPENLPSWASGLSASIRKEADYWISESSMGLVKVKFVEKNILVF